MNRVSKKNRTIGCVTVIECQNGSILILRKKKKNNNNDPETKKVNKIKTEPFPLVSSFFI